MTSYVNAPATKMLATHCAVCARPLLDAQSVECGIGPDCRKRYGYDMPEAADDVRKAANALVREIAKIQKGDAALALAEELRKLGWVQLSARIATRLTKIHIVEKGDGLLAVTTPYSSFFGSTLRAAIPGTRWDVKAKVWLVPEKEDGVRAKLHKILVDRFAGMWAVGPKGPFVLKAA